MEVRIDPLDIDTLAQASVEARPIDRIEAVYMTGRDISEAMYETYMLSSSAYSGWLDGELVCVWGVCAYAPMEGIGVPWLVATEKLEDAAVPFLRRCWYYLNKMKAEYDLLYNMVYAENDTAIQWLTWMGFEMQAAAPYGPMGKSFIPFKWSRGDV